MKCKAARKLLIDHLGGHLDPGDQRELAHHLETCSACARFWTGARQTVAAITPVHPVRASADFKERIMKEIALSHSLPVSSSKSSADRGIHRAGLGKPVWIAGLAAFLLLAIPVFDLLFFPNPESGRDHAAAGLLARAWAAEQELFTGEGIVYLVNEILVNPVKNPELAGIRWLPMGTLQASGQMQMNQLRLPAGPGESYRLSDTALYDPPTGRFMRIVQKDDQVIFATSYDGKSVFTFQPGGTGEARVVKIPVAEAFQAPKDPAGFLGIGAGFQSRIDEQDSTRVQRLEDTTLADGTPVRVLKTNPMTPEGTPESYMLFRIRQDNGTIAEMEWMAAGESLLLFRRIKTSTLEDRGIHWDLSEIDTKAKPGVSSPEVVPDMVIPDVSVEHMAEKADFAVYIFSATPAWTQRRVILDILDIASPPHRMFALAYPASDKRHVVMIQAVTYNQAFGGLVKQGTLIYTSPNGFKVWSTPQDKMGAMIALQSLRAVIQDAPSEDRTGYILESPAGTFPALAVNGPVIDDELHRLIDSLVPVKNVE